MEVKRGAAPKAQRGFHAACADLLPTSRYVVYPGSERFPPGEGVEAVSLSELAAELRK